MTIVEIVKSRFNDVVQTIELSSVLIEGKSETTKGSEGVTEKEEEEEEEEERVGAGALKRKQIKYKSRILVLLYRNNRSS